jgi:hypothetical protein
MGLGEDGAEKKMWFKDKMLPQGEDGLGRIWFIGEKIRL